MRGWLITNHFLKAFPPSGGRWPEGPDEGRGKFETLFSMLSDAAVSLNIELIRITNSTLWLKLAQWDYHIPRQHKPDFVLFWDKDTRLAFELERLGLRLFNSADSIAACDDKCETYLRCAAAGIPQPKSIISPKKFHADGIHDDTLPETVKKILGYPCVFKEAYGSFGQQVQLAEDEAGLIDMIKKCGERAYIIQEYLHPSCEDMDSRGKHMAGAASVLGADGISSHQDQYRKAHSEKENSRPFSRDLRVQVVGGRVIAAMLRENPHDFRANLTNGGTATDYTSQLSGAETGLAIKAAEVLDLDFAGVDLLFGENNTPLLCEVNSNAHFKNLYDCCKVNAAEAILNHIQTFF